MLIQCQTCDSKYRLNLERIPERKTFIKCKKCNAPIYIDPQEALAEGGESAAAAGPGGVGTDFQEPMAGAGALGETVVVECNNCEAHYRVPVQPLRRPGLQLKCTRCGYMFPVPAEVLAPPEEAWETPPGDGKNEAPEFFPAASEEETLGLGPGGPEMPLPDDSRMDSMFDDLKVKGEAGSEQAAAAVESEQAYLESVSYDDSGNPSMGTRGTIPDEQKYRFFLRPGQKPDPGSPEAAEANAPRNAAPETQAEPAAPAEAPDGAEAPPLPAAEAQGAAQPPGAAQAVEPEALAVPPFESEFPEETGMTETPETDPSLPALVIDEPMPDAHGDNRAVPGQEPPPGPVENRNFLFMAATLAVFLIVSVGWGLWIWMLPQAAAPFVVAEGSPRELAVTSTREGYFITNKPSGERLYVLTGQLMNRFAAAEHVSWVRLKGTAYTNSGKPTREAHAYVGNLLDDEQLATWELNAIQAYYGYTNGRNDVNFDIPQGKAVPYQIIMKGVRPPVARTEAKVVSFLRKGQPVYLEHF